MEVQLSLAGKETMFVQSLDMLYTVSVNKKVGCVIESMASNWNMSAFGRVVQVLEAWSESCIHWS